MRDAFSLLSVCPTKLNNSLGGLQQNIQALGAGVYVLDKDDTNNQPLPFLIGMFIDQNSTILITKNIIYEIQHTDSFLYKSIKEDNLLNCINN